jgi:multidrug resistance efflux pump
MSRWKAIPWVLGVAALAVSLVAAKMMNADTPANGGGNPAPIKPTATLGGPTVLGTVDTLQTVARIDAPGVMGYPSLVVQKVLVEDGETVTPGQVLVEFDSSVIQPKVLQAEKELIAALWEVEQTRKVKEDHADRVALQNLAILKAETDLRYATEGRDTVRDTMEKVLSVKDFQLQRILTDDEKKLKRRENADLQKLEMLVEETKLSVDKEKINLKHSTGCRH